MDPISAVVSIASNLITLLGQVKQLHDQRADNKDVIQEIKLFMTQLEQNLDVLKGLTPRNNTSRLAAESFLIHLRKAEEFMEKYLKKGYLKSLWNVNTAAMKLARTRENLLTEFQITLQYIIIDVSLNGQSKQEELVHRLHRSQAQSLAVLDDLSSGVADLNSNMGALTQTVTSTAADARSERQAILKLLLDLKAMAMDERQQQDFSAHITAQIERTDAQTNEAEKFFADVVANLHLLQPSSAENWFEDPLTKEVMCDPIKGSDGRTYDRWTIIDHNLVKCPYDADMLDFGIAIDDIDVRSRLFERFPEQAELFKSRRQKHRQEAFEHVARGEHADALTKLNQVLQWDKRDRECAAKRELILHLTQQTMAGEQQPLQVNLMHLPSIQVPLELQTRLPGHMHGVAKGDLSLSAPTFSTAGDSYRKPQWMLASVAKEEPSSWMQHGQQVAMDVDTHKCKATQGHSELQASFFQDDDKTSYSGAPNPHDAADGAAPSYIVLHNDKNVVASRSAGEEIKFELVDASKWVEFGIGIIVRGEVQYLYAEGPKVLATLNSYRDSVGFARTVWQVVADAPLDGTALSSMSFALKNKDTGARLYYNFEKASFYGAWVESNVVSRHTHWRLWRSSQDATRYKLQYIQGPGRGQFAEFV